MTHFTDNEQVFNDLTVYCIHLRIECVTVCQVLNKCTGLSAYTHRTKHR